MKAYTLKRKNYFDVCKLDWSISKHTFDMKGLICIMLFLHLFVKFSALVYV